MEALDRRSAFLARQGMLKGLFSIQGLQSKCGREVYFAHFKKGVQVLFTEGRNPGDFPDLDS